MSIRKRLNYWMHWRTGELGAAVLVPLTLLVWWLTGEWSPLP